jgi:hypothetical protein
MKAAFAAYTEREMPVLRQERPGLKLSRVSCKQYLRGARTETAERMKNVLRRSVQGHHMEELAKGAREPHGAAGNARQMRGRAFASVLLFCIRGNRALKIDVSRSRCATKRHVTRKHKALHKTTAASSRERVHSISQKGTKVMAILVGGPNNKQRRRQL